MGPLFRASAKSYKVQLKFTFFPLAWQAVNYSYKYNAASLNYIPRPVEAGIFAL
jgi:hypothetical protein